MRPYKTPGHLPTGRLLEQTYPRGHGIIVLPDLVESWEIVRLSWSLQSRFPLAPAALCVEVKDPERGDRFRRFVVTMTRADLRRFAAMTQAALGGAVIEALE